MGGVKLVCGCAALLVVAGQIAAMPTDKRQALMSSARLLIGGQPLAGPRVASLSPSPRSSPVIVSAPAAFQTETLAPDRFGQFQATIEVDGQRLPVLVDTGASFVALSFEDADRLGLRPMPADFKYWSSTANGRVAYAKADLREVWLGSISVRDVTAFIGPRGALSTSLLGMSFLAKLSGFKVDEGRLVLQQ